ncbi:uncharacterized protein BHQ10_009932 [Talaromyces amestolkiae]|uniref:Gylcosyl hydrolase 115 C-terminal domain-containing protein n=1 Tax=Talaromyces amestolkiae TaxID=1196081 RepID=A0A364LDM3_TALAM|nr:uncharacterized protein BHQ10_009932 [Talaromyces amestolkiae]RAO73920.1 hypothetical protein BHQ10_009932 [Talaromyces amestolkiae]
MADNLVTFQPEEGKISLAGGCILLDRDDFQGVHIAASFLSKDFEMVTGSPLSLTTYEGSLTEVEGKHCVIVGTIESSRPIQTLIQSGKLNVDEIQGCWESFVMTVVDNPMGSVKKSLVIAGSDKRGTIYGVYTLSEQIGVSPWYWWADVVPTKHSDIFIQPGRVRCGPPTVKYRGIFINDEAPSLTGWVLEKFGPKYNVEFYRKVFELLLRLKANFMWPAMWPGYPNPGNSFFADDALNQKTANEWGIVVSTSHHEPMQRAMAEWFAENPAGSWSWIKSREKIQDYFKDGASRAHGYESYITLGMRGDGDRAMAVDDPPAVLREILEVQRSIINDVYGAPDKPNQLLALYKEVQEYFENGLVVPDDVTLLFADDNFGNIRRLPVGMEENRAGRAGIYFHLEYVGEPRSYKWINSNSCVSSTHQIWVFNVGDIKPLELPITFAMKMAWDIASIPMEDFESFFQSFSCLNFPPSISSQSAQLLYHIDRLLALRKHEHIEHDTFSILNYNEAENIWDAWEILAKQAEELYTGLQDHERAAFFELVLHPIKASSIYTRLRVSQAKNRLFGLQRRNTTNEVAQEVLDLFDADFDLSEEYHSLLGGKWNHMLRQPHYGYRETWHAPSRDMIDGICYVQTRQDSNPIVGHMGVAVEGEQGTRPGLTNEESDRTHPSRGDLIPGLTLPPLETFGQKTRYFEIFRRGTALFTWKVSLPHDWIKATPSSGTLDNDTNDARVYIEVDWNSAPPEFDEIVQLAISSSVGDYDHVHLPIIRRKILVESFTGFIESDGCISIPATRFSRPVEGSQYQIIPFLGRTEYGVVERSHAKKNSTAAEMGFLEYDFYVFSNRTEPPKLVLYFTTTLDTDTSDPLTYEVMVDKRSYGELRLMEDAPKIGDLPPGWTQAVQDCVWTRTLDLHETVHSGEHVIRIRLCNQNLLLEKIVVDFGGVRESYLGPLPSTFVKDGLVHS